MLIIGFATIPLGRRPPRPPPERVHARSAISLTGDGELKAGAARVELAAPSGGPLAGYPPWRRDDGSGEPIFVRAIALEQGPLRAVLLSLPLLLLPGSLEEELVREAELDDQTCLLAAATHTHSGPGGTWDNLVVALGGNGLYAEPRARAVAVAAAQAIRLARSRMAPAHFATALDRWPEGPAAARSGVLDDALGAARLLDSDNRAIASLAIYGMHATVVPRSQRGLSGDWPEAAARDLEELTDRAPALIFQGAGGNATWKREGKEAPAQQVSALGAQVAAQAARELSGATLFPAAAQLACREHLVALPEPEAGSSIFRPVRRAASNLLRLSMERTALLSELDLPGLQLLGVPGEPVGDLGVRARKLRDGHAMLVGLADGYAGYIETRERWLRGDGETKRTWYGPELAGALGLE